MGNPLLRRSQIGIESVFGTATAPTVQLPGALTLKNAPRRERREEHRFSMGGSNVYDDLSYSSTGTYTGRCTTTTLPYWLAAGMRGDVTPTTPSGTVKLWTYTQPLSTIPALKSLTAYMGDNTEALRAAGVSVRRITITGNDTDAWTVSVDLIGQSLAAGSGSTYDFATLTTPTHETAKNLLSRVYLDDTGAGIGTTAITATFYGFTWVWDSGITPDYTMDNQLDMTDIQRGEPTTTLELRLKWNATAVTEHTNWRSAATRFVRVANFGSVISTTYRHQIFLDGAYVITDFDPIDNERDGTTLSKISLTAVEDVTWGKKVEVSVQNITASL
jgi:hypothetical protein